MFLSSYSPFCSEASRILEAAQLKSMPCCFDVQLSKSLPALVGGLRKESRSDAHLVLAYPNRMM